MRDALALGFMVAVIGVCSWYLRATRPLTRDQLLRMAQRNHDKRLGHYD